MSRIINLDSSGKERSRFSKAIVLAIRELALQNRPGVESRDLVAFIIMALTIIAETIEASVAAWERRGYWVKADKFRMDWAWAGQLAEKMRIALLAEDWVEVAQLVDRITHRLNKIEVTTGHRLGKPWVGAWQEFQKMENPQR